jgi:iron complex transport system ATP-binding protein
MTDRLILEALCVRMKGRALLQDATFSVRAGEIVALLGANGAGKSTLLRSCYGLAPISAGRALLSGRDATKLDSASRALACTYLPQERAMVWPIAVRACVALGRFAYGAAPHRLGLQDQRAVDEAITACALEALADRPMNTLSGGEAARVHVARAFAARAPLTLADEPIAALDPHHAWRVMGLFAAYCAAGGAALIALHDLDMALQFAHRCVVLKEGAVLAAGAPEAVLTPEVLAQAYGVSGRVLEVDGRARLIVSGAD